MARSRAPRTIRLVFKLLLTLLIITVTAILGWRIGCSEDYSLTKGVTPNDTLKAAYATHGDNLILQYQEDRATITKAEDNYGYFSVIEYVYIPQAQQLQVNVRYNNSTLKHLKEDYGLSEAPDRALDWYDVTVAISTDLTPDDQTDNLNQDALSIERIHATGEPVRENTTLYSYRRYTFDNVILTDNTVGMFVDIYYNGDINYEKDAYGTLLIYDKTAPWYSYELSKDEREALSAP